MCSGKSVILLIGICEFNRLMEVIMRLKKTIALVLSVLLILGLLAGCGKAKVPSDGDYTVDVKFEGGSGKATILSPATLHVKDGKMTATVKWSSENYDYMKVGDTKIEPDSITGGSVFTIPVSQLGAPFKVIGDTVAMSTPHEIEYTITLTLQK